MSETWIKIEVSKGNQYQNESTGEVILAYGTDYDGRWLDLKTKIDNDQVTIVNLEDTDAHKEQLKLNKINDSSSYWYAKSMADITYNTKVFAITSMTYTYVLGQQQAAKLHEEANGAGTWSYDNWRLKDRTYYSFDLTDLNGFGMVLAGQTENCAKNENDHAVAIAALDVTVKTAAEIEAYDFTLDLQV